MPFESRLQFSYLPTHKKKTEKNKDLYKIFFVEEVKKIFDTQKRKKN